MKQRTQIETVVYGGAFNPPTLAHVVILRACLEYARARGADVWIMPSGNRLDKVIPVSRERRLEYINALIHDAAQSDDDVTVVVSELDRQVYVETIDTLRELETTYPERTFTFVFGADSTETMSEWKDGDELLARLPMLVVEREGSRINPKARRAMPLKVKTPDVSSTQVRALLQSGGSLDGFVSPSVAQLFT